MVHANLTCRGGLRSIVDAGSGWPLGTRARPGAARAISAAVPTDAPSRLLGSLRGANLERAALLELIRARE